MRVITDRTGISELLVDETLSDPEHPLYFHVRTVPPGSRSHAPHTHDPEAGQVEAMLVLEGEAEVQIEDERRTVHAGQAVLINTRRLHGFRNTGQTDLRYVVIVAPGRPRS